MPHPTNHLFFGTVVGRDWAYSIKRWLPMPPESPVTSFSIHFSVAQVGPKNYEWLVKHVQLVWPHFNLAEQAARDALERMPWDVQPELYQADADDLRREHFAYSEICTKCGRRLRYSQWNDWVCTRGLTTCRSGSDERHEPKGVQ
jgi:hypothetical protein